MPAPWPSSGFSPNAFSATSQNWTRPPLETSLKCSPGLAETPRSALEKRFQALPPKAIPRMTTMTRAAMPMPRRTRRVAGDLQRAGDRRGAVALGAAERPEEEQGERRAGEDQQQRDQALFDEEAGFFDVVGDRVVGGDVEDRRDRADDAATDRSPASRGGRCSAPAAAPRRRPGRGCRRASRSGRAPGRSAGSRRRRTSAARGPASAASSTAASASPSRRRARSRSSSRAGSGRREPVDLVRREVENVGQEAARERPARRRPSGRLRCLHRNVGAFGRFGRGGTRQGRPRGTPGRGRPRPRSTRQNRTREMRLQTKSQNRGSTRSPSRTASPGSPDRRLRGPAGPPPPARRPGRRRGDRSVRSRLRPAQGPRSGRPERGTPPIPLTLRGMQGAPRRRLGPLLLRASASACSAGIGRASRFRSRGRNPLSTKSNPTNCPRFRTRPRNRRSLSRTDRQSKTKTKQPAGEGFRKRRSPAESSDRKNRKKTPKRKSRRPAAPAAMRRRQQAAGGGEGAKPQQAAAATTASAAAKVAEAGGGNVTPVAHKTETSSGGGSSPVVPILIAVIVLAAISIGVVLYRQRKSGGQGPDRSVSSPNAS